MKINIEPENDGGLVGRWFSLKPGVYSLSAFRPFLFQGVSFVQPKPNVAMGWFHLTLTYIGVLKSRLHNCSCFFFWGAHLPILTKKKHFFQPNKPPGSWGSSFCPLWKGDFTQPLRSRLVHQVRGTKRCFFGFWMEILVPKDPITFSDDDWGV